MSNCDLGCGKEARREETKRRMKENEREREEEDERERRKLVYR